MRSGADLIPYMANAIHFKPKKQSKRLFNNWYRLTQIAKQYTDFQIKKALITSNAAHN